MCSIGDITLLEYLLRQPGISDPPIEDGTTAYSVALGRNEPLMSKMILAKIWNEDYQQLTIDAFVEIERQGCPPNYESMRRVLIGAMETHNVPEPIVKDEPSPESEPV